VVLRESSVPAILLESLFLSNSANEKMLAATTISVYQIALGVAVGISEYLAGM
jgi:N-acetylmuramoyl-L-alanine amidase